jgi:hypothetical protein
MGITEPEAALDVLRKADGSARYSYGGYTITASVNGPIEAQRRDEHPYEAHLDVIVRPAAGVGGMPLGARALLALTTIYSFCVYRDPRETPRDSSAVLPLPAHPRQELPTLSDPDCSSG